MKISDNGRRAWRDVVNIPLRGRTEKPRAKGITMVIDKGLTISDTEELVDMCGDYIDLVKLSFGTSALYRENTLAKKIELLKNGGVRVCPGGTFAELAIIQGKLEHFLRYAVSVGFDTVEISDGCVKMRRTDKLEAICAARESGLMVISEVGKKHPEDHVPVEELAHQMVGELEAGAEYVVLEARESGKGVTIFDNTGQIRSEDVQTIKKIVNANSGSIIWEAPQPSQQKDFVIAFGPNVNLGNVAPSEVLALEALRVGLRGDTLREHLNGTME